MFDKRYFPASYFGPNYFGPAVEVSGHPTKGKIKTLEEKQEELLNTIQVQKSTQDGIISTENIPEVTENRDFVEANIEELIKEKLPEVGTDEDIMEILAFIEATS